MNKIQVILVDEQDRVIGAADKLEAHKRGYLHRAFSIFIVDSRGRMLLQQRALDKYHSGGLWSNACCSHPLPGETTAAAARRRLMEEMGFQCPLKKLFAFTYRCELNNGMTEHEYDHVFLGVYDGLLNPDPDEVFDYRYWSIDEIVAAMHESPGRFTSWFLLSFQRVAQHFVARQAVN